MIGNSWFIMLSTADVKDFGFKIGDEVDIEDIKKIKGRKK